jgi:hypothetical protein
MPGKMQPGEKERNKRDSAVSSQQPAPCAILPGPVDGPGHAAKACVQANIPFAWKFFY